MGWYSKFLTRFPYISILAVMAVSIIFGGVAFKFKGDQLLNFTNAARGLEPRGTLRHGWSLAAHKLRTMLQDKELAIVPFGNVARKKRHAQLRPLEEHSSLTFSANKQRVKRQASPPSDKCLDLYLGGYPGPHMVIETSDKGGNLLTPSALRAVCRLEEEFVRKAFTNNSCPPHSLALYVAGSANKSCDQIEQSDIDNFTRLISDCAPFYFSQNLPGAPEKCFTHDIAYKTLHFLADKEFGSSTFDKVVHGLLVLHFVPNTKADEVFLDYYVDYLSGKNLDNGEVRISGIELYNIKFQVFNRIMRQDLPYFALAAAVIFLILALYLRSFVLVIATLVNVSISFTVALFIFFYIFQFKFFPVMNLMAGLILIAIGADDIFVLHDFWTSTKQMYGPEVAIETLVSRTLQHGAVSIFVTSFTTAAAFAANIVSNITAIRLFGVFSGICVVVNFLFMITWMVGVMVLIEKGDRLCCKTQFCRPFLIKLEKFNGWIYKKLLPIAIIKPAIFWVILFILIGTGGLILVFYKPRLNLPSGSTFQFFKKSHPLERYDLELKDYFRFTEQNSEAFDFLNIQLLWGIEGKDNGDWLNPDDTGTLKFDDNFNMYDQESMKWLRQVCRDLLNQNFVTTKTKYMCIMDEVKILAEGTCNNTEFLNYGGITTNCCETTFPGNSTLNEMCLKNFLQNNWLSWYVQSRNLKLLGTVLYDTDDKTKAFRYLFESTQKFTQNNGIMTDFYDSLSSFMTTELQSAPNGLKNGWFAGLYRWTFYLLDLQESIATGTFIGISISLVVGFLVLMFTTPNIFLAGNAIVSIAFAIAITVGTLASQGWELNIIESVIITVSVGLSIDFTIHYCVAYRKSEEFSRKLRVRDALNNVGSAVSMAALTTFLAGAAIMPGRAIIYVQFGVFLMLVMAASWLFANFFFLSLCSLIGPQGKTGEILELFKKCCRKGRSIETRQSHQKNYNKQRTRYSDNWNMSHKTERWHTINHRDKTYRKRLPRTNVSEAPRGGSIMPRSSYFPYSPYPNMSTVPITRTPVEQMPYQSMLNATYYRQNNMYLPYSIPRTGPETYDNTQPYDRTINYGPNPYIHNPYYYYDAHASRAGPYTDLSYYVDSNMASYPYVQREHM